METVLLMAVPFDISHAHAGYQWRLDGFHDEQGQLYSLRALILELAQDGGWRIVASVEVLQEDKQHLISPKKAAQVIAGMIRLTKNANIRSFDDGEGSDSERQGSGVEGDCSSDG